MNTRRLFFSFSILIYLTFNVYFRFYETTTISVHQAIHLAIFLGKKSQILGELSSLKSQGLFHLLIISGLHFYIFMETLSESLSDKFKLFLPLILFCLWETSIPLLRAFYFYQCLALSEKFNLFWPRSFVLLISIVLCSFHLENTYHFYSLCLSSFFCLWLDCLSQRIKLNPYLFQFSIFFVAPLFFPFAVKFHFLAFITNLYLIPVILGFFIFSPLLHLVNYQHLCHSSYQFILSAFEKIERFAPIYYENHFRFEKPLIYLITFYFILWRYDLWKKQKLISSNS